MKKTLNMRKYINKSVAKHDWDETIIKVIVLSVSIYLIVVVDMMIYAFIST